MINKEKIIKGLEMCQKKKITGIGCIECPYAEEKTDDWCIRGLYHDALVLLKEQETEWEHLWDAPDGTFKGRCKKCGFIHSFIEGHDGQYKFCPACGRTVK